MAEYTLHYFNLMARAETTRLLFKLAGKEFTDKRLEFSEWPEVKPTMPLGQLPALEVDGKMLVQSMAIARYVARELGLSGETSWDQAVGDMFCDTCTDILAPCGMFKFRCKTEEDKAEKVQQIRSGVAGLAKLYCMHKKGDFVLGDKPTLGDAAVFATLAVAELVVPDVLSGHDCLNCLKEKFSKLPAIATWIESRPTTPL